MLKGRREVQLRGARRYAALTRFALPQDAITDESLTAESNRRKDDVVCKGRAV